MTSTSQTDFSDSLRKAGLQVTGQRLAVHRAAKALPHAMAEYVSDKVRIEIGAITIGTKVGIVPVMT